MNEIFSKLKHYYYLYLFFLIKYFSFRKFLNLLLNLYEYKTKKIVVKSIPFKVHFDVANICVLHCPLCPTGRREKGQSKGTINFEKFKMIFNQLRDYLFFIRLYNWGEPFLCKDLFKIVDYCHESNVGVQLHSNLNCYSDEILENIVKSKVDYLHLSIDGYTQEGYEFYRVGGNIHKALQGLKKIIEYKQNLKSKYPIIHWGYLINNKNKDEVERARAYAKKIKVDIFESYYISLFNKLDDEYNQDDYDKFLSKIKDESSCARRKSKSHCNFLWCGLAINPNMSFSPCCIIYKDSDAFDLFNNKKRIQDIFNSEIFIESRKLFKFKSYKSKCTTPCNRCNWFTKP
jgi:MoaA/NifB/PqqE/SkfB family radical SAM enzyme